MSNGYIMAADDLIKPAIEHMINTRIINPQEAQQLFNAYQTNKYDFQNGVSRKYPGGCTEEGIKIQLFEFLKHLLNVIRQSTPAWGAPNFQQQPQFQQPMQFQQPQHVAFNQPQFVNTPIDPYATPSQQQPIQHQQPIQQQTIQPEVKMTEQVFSMDTLFTKAIPSGSIKDVSIERFVQGKTQTMKHDIHKIDIEQYKLFRGYNNDLEAINAIEINKSKTKYKEVAFIKFIQYNKLVTIDVPQDELCGIFELINTKIKNKNAVEVVKIILDVLETVSAANSRIIAKFFIDRINEVLPFLTSSEEIDKEIIIVELVEILELIEETSVPYLNNLRLLEGYDEVLSDIIKDTILTIVSAATICDFTDDSSTLGDVLHAAGNQHIVDGYINRDYYLLAIKDNENKSDDKSTFEKLNDLLASKTVVNVKHLVVYTNLYPEEYRVNPNPDAAYGVTNISNHLDQFMNDIVKYKMPTTLLIQPSAKVKHEFIVSKTIDKVLRISKD